MKVSLSWLKELVDYKISDKELAELLPLKTIGIKDATDSTIELDMKGYNRADLLSLRGVAYEVAAITDGQIKFTDDEPDIEKLLSNKKDLKVEVRDIQLCPFYSLLKIEGLKVGPSPKDWVKKLEESGYRSTNNLADITNLIMLEYGQPLHAFDADQVTQEKIIVRTSQEGEKITTLDGKTRSLLSPDLLITDPDKALGIAGVMGGKDSEVSDDTTTILLEAAIFGPKNIRQTATRLGLISEAGKRFYHGLTKKRLYQTLAAAIKMYEELGGVVTAYSIEDYFTETQPIIELSKEKVDSLIGVDIPEKDIEDHLIRLNFSTKQVVSGKWQVIPPYWRLDIEIPEDLIEEIARLYGYEKIPAKPLEGELPNKIDQTLFETIYQIKRTLVDLGLTEVQTYSFYSTEVLNNLQLDKKDLVKIANPISSETEYLRDRLWPNLVEVVVKNTKQGFKDIAIFELGKVYLKKDDVPEEKYHLSLALMNGTDNPIQELNQILKTLKLETNSEELKKRFFHPTRFTPQMAEVHPRIINRFGLDKRVTIAEVDLEKII